jgi:hypothetical protein
MSKRTDSVNNDDHEKCVDIFYRPDGTFGFEEFRRDVEDAGEWTPLGYYSGATYASSVAAYDAAESATLLGSRKYCASIRP